MIKRTLAMILSAILLSAAFDFHLVHAQAGGQAQFAETARASIARLGTGKDARVAVKLRDNTKVKGYVSEAGGDSFTIIDAKTGVSRRVAYADVRQVSRQGNGLSTRTKAIIGAAIATGVIVGWLVVKPAVCDGGAQHRGPC